MLRRLRDWMGIRPVWRQVGVDKAGNKYFLNEQEKNAEGYFRRKIEYAKGEPDSGSVPVIWQQWLRFTRANAPTSEEYELFEKKQKEFKANAMAWERRDNKLRQQEMALKELMSEEEREEYDKRGQGFSDPLSLASSISQSQAKKESE